MRQFTISAAVLAIATLAIAIPAQAEQNYGPVTQNGQCWKEAAGPAAGARFGFWGPCAEKASAVTTTTAKPKKHHAAAR